MAVRRIKKELNDIILNPPIACNAELNDGDLYHWKANLTGPTETPYDGGLFDLDIRFPLDYPFSPPKIVFLTKIYHPNINASGNICLDILKDNWSPVLTISKIILSLSSLLSDPNPDDPLETEIAQLYRDDYDKWFETAQSHTRRWAFPTLEPHSPTTIIPDEESKDADLELETKVDNVDTLNQTTTSNSEDSAEAPVLPVEFNSDTSEDNISENNISEDSLD